MPTADRSSGCSVYGLIDPVDGRVRYIGLSSNVEVRVKKHIRGSLAGWDPNPHKAAWIKKLAREGLEPLVVVYGTWSRPEAEAAERRFIAEHRVLLGADLTNVADGGTGGITLTSSAARDKHRPGARAGGLRSAENRRAAGYYGSERFAEVQQKATTAAAAANRGQKKRLSLAGRAVHSARAAALARTVATCSCGYAGNPGNVGKHLKRNSGHFRISIVSPELPPEAK